MVWTCTQGIDLDSWYRLGLMVWPLSHGIDLDSWYSIGTLESLAYKRAECCPYATNFAWSLAMNTIFDFKQVFCNRDNANLMNNVLDFDLATKSNADFLSPKATPARG